MVSRVRLDARTAFALDARMPDEAMDLEALCIGVARIQRPEPDPDSIRGTLDRLAAQVQDLVHPGAPPDQLSAQLREAFIGQLGFHGNTEDYGDPSNSFLDVVLERRTGLPILLSITWILLAQRLGVRLAGISYPGHFLVSVELEGVRIFLDPFHAGVERDPGALLAQLGPNAPRSVLQPASVRAIIVRVLTNLRHVWVSRRRWAEALEVVERTQLLVGERADDVRDRGLLLVRLDRAAEAVRELDRYLHLAPGAADRDEIEQLLQGIRPR